jgi:hypothetical protein
MGEVDLRALVIALSVIITLAAVFALFDAISRGDPLASAVLAIALGFIALTTLLTALDPTIVHGALLKMSTDISNIEAKLEPIGNDPSIATGLQQLPHQVRSSADHLAEIDAHTRTLASDVRKLAIRQRYLFGGVAVVTCVALLEVLRQKRRGTS